MIDTEIDDIELRLKKYSIDKPDLLKFKKTVEFNSIKIDLVCVEYTDKIFLSISSTGKFGTVLIAKSEKTPDCILYTVKNLFGQFEPTINVFARSLVEKLYSQHSVSKPVLFSVSVAKSDLNNIDLFKYFESQVLELYARK